MQSFDACTCGFNHRRISATCPRVCAPVGLNRSAYAPHLCSSEQAAWGRGQRGDLLAHMVPSRASTLLGHALAVNAGIEFSTIAEEMLLFSWLVRKPQHLAWCEGQPGLSYGNWRPRW